jgi:hypothetical protein
VLLQEVIAASRSCAIVIGVELAQRQPVPSCCSTTCTVPGA